jgi:DnaK suppressor protein
MSKGKKGKAPAKAQKAPAKPVRPVAKAAPAKSAAKAKSAPVKSAKPASPVKKTTPVKAPKAPLKPAPKVAHGMSAQKAKAAEPARTMAVEAVTKKSGGAIKSMAARAKIADIVLPPDYKPSENEPFMSDKHQAYFRKRLMEWKDEILRQTRETLAILHEDSSQHADLADRATSETDRATELRTRDRQRKLIAKIDAALSRIEDGSYGYCEDTGEPIGLKRLDARPIATLSVEAQERHERREKVYREE